MPCIFTFRYSGSIIAASIMSTVLMTLISVLIALPAIITHLYGAGRAAQAG